MDKCLPFGASISCSHYQHFSNALRHILMFRARKESANIDKLNAVTNYLDDFLFIAIMKALCNQLIDAFLQMCKDLWIPVAIEKTEWASNMIIFLGILLHSGRLMLSLPIEKQEKALRLLRDMCDRK